MSSAGLEVDETCVLEKFIWHVSVDTHFWFVHTLLEKASMDAVGDRYSLLLFFFETRSPEWFTLQEVARRVTCTGMFNAGFRVTAEHKKVVLEFFATRNKHNSW